MSSSLNRVSGANPSRHPGTDPRRLQNRLSFVKHVSCSRFSTHDMSEVRRTVGGVYVAHTGIQIKHVELQLPYLYSGLIGTRLQRCASIGGAGSSRQMCKHTWSSTGRAMIKET